MKEIAIKLASDKSQAGFEYDEYLAQYLRNLDQSNLGDAGFYLTKFTLR